MIERAANDNAKKFKKRTSDFHTFDFWMKSQEIITNSLPKCTKRRPSFADAVSPMWGCLV
ncbi:hypothetical protein B472_00080 [Limnohabitans sp. Rim28]|nr:hypothetical protein B472_00080 [Limnohabitans sp. Rim28]